MEKQHWNVAQTGIYVTEDKVRLVVAAQMTQLARRRDWVGPVGVTLSLLASMLTTEFQDRLNLEADTWLGIFATVTVASCVWSLIALYRALTAPSAAKQVDALVEALKG